jgi:hypothetical protein
VVLSVNKQPDAQMNYGTGKDVSDESITDAKVPMQIKCFNDSYVDIPVWRQISAAFTLLRLHVDSALRLRAQCANSRLFSAIQKLRIWCSGPERA